MAEQTRRRFSFVSDALDARTFEVVRFTGTEQLSRLYFFDIVLLSRNPDPDLEAAMDSTGTFTIHGRAGDAPFHGVPRVFEQLHAVGSLYFYRVELVPRIWRMSLSRQNQLFLEKPLPAILTEVLRQGELASRVDFEFRLQREFERLEYVCQYQESLLDFFCRWLEREGLAFHFEQGEQGERLILLDTDISRIAAPHAATLEYSATHNLDQHRKEQVVQSFRMRQQALPRQVLLKDFNPQLPSLNLQARARVSDTGHGEIYIYAEHFRTLAEGNRLARIRAEEILCREKIFSGSSCVPFLRPGYLFELQRHFRDAYNQEYLVTEVEHEGSQEDFLHSQMGMPSEGVSEHLDYRNTFTCIPDRLQYRPERLTPRPQCTGNLNARIDAAGSGKYAELDEQGRYKVVLPLDISGRKEGKASAWLRMAQPYAGGNCGMHFPLRKDAEVLLTFENGDPDRPVIAAAVPNPENPSVVTGQNQSNCVISTGGQNQLIMQDKEGGEHIVLHSGGGSTWLRMGNPNDPPPAASVESAAAANAAGWTLGAPGFRLSTAGSYAQAVDGSYLLNVGSSAETITMGNSTLAVMGNVRQSVAGNSFSSTLGMDTRLLTGGNTEFNPVGFRNVRAATTSVTGEKTSLTTTNTSFLGSDTRMKGQETTLANESTSVAAQATRMGGDVTSLYGGLRHVAGESVQMTGETTAMHGKATTMQGETTAVHGGLTHISDRAVFMDNQRTEISESRTSMSSDQTSIADDSSEIVGMKMIM